MSVAAENATGARARLYDRDVDGIEANHPRQPDVTLQTLLGWAPACDTRDASTHAPRIRPGTVQYLGVGDTILLGAR